MVPAPSTILGALTGLIAFLALAIIGVVAVNGAENPGIDRRQGASAAAGASAGPDPLAAHSLDLDGDGTLSLAEVAGHPGIVMRFDRADRNRDGRLTKAEFERLAKLPAPKARSGPTMQQIRRDANASLSKTD